MTINDFEEVLTDVICEQIIQLHRQALQTSRLTRLGHKAMKTFYHFVAQSKSETLIWILSEKSQLMGFAMLSHQPQTLLKRLAIARFGQFLCPAIFNYFTSLLHKTDTIDVPGRYIESGTSDCKRSYLPELVFIAVTDQVRGQNIGTKLLNRIEVSLLAQGVKAYQIHTENHIDNQAISFYLKNGFSSPGYATKDMIVMIKEIS